VEDLRKVIRYDPRKLIPVAVVAREFGVSSRLVWKWINEGLVAKKKKKSRTDLGHKREDLIAKKPTVDLGKKSGLTKSALLTFLKRLKKVADFESEDYLEYHDEFGAYFSSDYYDDCRPDNESRAGRPDKARRKIREARQRGVDGQGMNPRQFALAVGVSRASVLRAIASGDLMAWNPTPHRTLIGRRPRASKKVGVRRRK
jgi:hypothetical protein